MDVNSSSISNSVTGTTAAAYVAAVTIYPLGKGTQGKVLFIINNTHASYTMYYKIDGYASRNSSYSVPIKAETSIGTTTQVVSTDTDKAYDMVVLSVKDVVGGNHATYQVDAMTY
jgi:hypothetical protein